MIAIIILSIFIDDVNECFIEDLKVSFYKIKVKRTINKDVISLYLYKILHPP